MIKKKKQGVGSKPRDENLRVKQLRMSVLLAEMRSPHEVATTLSAELNVKLTRHAVYQFSKTKHGSRLIKILNKKFLTNLTKIPIANKAVRLRRLERIYNEAMTESLKSRGQFGDVYEVKLGSAIDALAKTREEIEGKGGTFIENKGKMVFQDIKIEGRTFEELITDINNRISSQFT